MRDSVPATEEIPSCVSEKNLRARWEACCSHIAYANTCVMLELHQGIQHNSPELAQSMKCFEQIVAKAWRKEPANPWPRILANDAPRAIGDAFIACLGAIVLDGGYPAATEIMKKHVSNCETMPFPQVADAELCSPKGISCDSLLSRLSAADLQNVVRDARGTVCELACTPPPLSPLSTNEGASTTNTI